MTTQATTTPAAMSITADKQSIMSAASFMALASIALFPHFVLCALVGPSALACVAIATIGGVFLSFEFAFALLVVCLFLQNLFIALVTPLIPGLDQFTPMLATSFINISLTAAFALLFWLKLRREMPAENKSLLISLFMFFAVIIAYTGLGAIHASLNDALIYMRVYVVGGMMLIIGVALGMRLNFGFAINVFRGISFVLVVWGLLEFFFAYDLYSIFHIADYIHLKYANSPNTLVNNVNDMINFASRSYLNLSGSMGLNIELLRPQGPNVHPISYAYGLSFGAIVCYVYGFFALTLGCIALLLLIGAKGPIIMALVSILLSIAYGITRKRTIVLTVLLVSMGLYTFIGIIYGFYTEDYHVVGLMGGVRGFISNPVGHGVGVGGNLSTMTLNYGDFSLFQGYGATFALESGFGVMIYQIGVCTVFFFLFYWRLWSGVWKTTIYFSNEPRLIAVPFALAILLVNSVFQEEAFSPAGWGPLLLLSGLMLARRWQQEKLQKA